MEALILLLGRVRNESYIVARRYLRVVMFLVALVFITYWQIESGANLNTLREINLQLRSKRELLQAWISREEQRVRGLEASSVDPLEVKEMYQLDNPHGELSHFVSNLAVGVGIEFDEIVVDGASECQQSNPCGYRCRVHGNFEKLVQFVSELSENGTRFVVSEVLLRNTDWPRFHGIIDAEIMIREVRRVAPPKNSSNEAVTQRRATSATLKFAT